MLIRTVLLGLLVAGCAPAAPVASQAPPVLGIDWARAPSLERPANFQETVPPDFVAAHPILRIPGQAIMTDVVGRPDGGALALGYVPPDWTPAAWTSPDGLTWALHSMGSTDFTIPVGLASARDGSAVAVGRSRKLPMAWTTRDGVAWASHRVPVLGTAGVAERMTCVVAGPSGFVAGGSVGPEISDRDARFWTSVDGVDWQPVSDDAAAFGNAEVLGITTFKGGFVAVGVVGNVQQRTGAVAWTSPDGVRWTRVDDPAFDVALVVAVIEAPFGGLVAVGSDLDRIKAFVWTSPDGRVWTHASGEPGRLYDTGFTWLTDVVAVGSVVIASGNYQGLQRPSATSWVSTDGITWERARDVPVLSQGVFNAIAAGGPGAIAVGDFGIPDSTVPTVWVSPGR